MEILIAFILGYFALLALLSVAARPARLRLRKLAAELRADYRTDLAVCEFIEAQTRSAYSWRAAAIDTFVLAATLIVPARLFWEKAQRIEADHPVLFSDTRFSQFDDAYSVSIAAVNPFFGLTMYALGLILLVKMMAHAKRSDVKRHIPPLGLLNPA